MLEFLKRVQEATPAGFQRIQYIEQPTKRDLQADRANVMHEASALRPVVIDESLIDQESILLAKEMGYTGVALKACKGQTQSLLMAAVAQKEGMFVCVQDLTCPGASLIQSASLAAHIPGIVAIESNARQYCPKSSLSFEVPNSICCGNDTSFECLSPVPPIFRRVVPELLVEFKMPEGR